MNLQAASCSYTIDIPSPGGEEAFSGVVWRMKTWAAFTPPVPALKQTGVPISQGAPQAGTRDAMAASPCLCKSTTFPAVGDDDANIAASAARGTWRICECSRQSRLETGKWIAPQQRYIKSCKRRGNTCPRPNATLRDATERQSNAPPAALCQ